jgi:hypothetical protein
MFSCQELISRCGGKVLHWEPSILLYIWRWSSLCSWRVKQRAWDIYRYCWSCLRASLLHCYIALRIVLLTVANLTRIVSSNGCAQGKDTSGFWNGGKPSMGPNGAAEQHVWLKVYFFTQSYVLRDVQLSAPPPHFPLLSRYRGFSSLCLRLEREVLRDDVDTLSALIPGGL